MLSKAPYPSFTQFVLALKAHNQTLSNDQFEDSSRVDPTQAFLSSRGRGRGRQGGWFSSHGRCFNPIGRSTFSSPVNNWSYQENQNPRTSGGKTDEKPIPNNAIVCQICTRPYHTADKCWNCYDLFDEPRNAQQAYTAFQGADDNIFYADSGANAHMTNQEGSKQANNSKRSRRGGLYALDNGYLEALNVVRKGMVSSSLLHQRPGHPNSRIL
ncbi:uncharacterized protein LOC112492535 [Ziziphus jujuba]|uniref:Uncharacterized protein LOC112492535 n=1 Tax=Ziziphus jujuba TaxID=326968 RepID=A0ABM3ISP1_ZIZJJ|nr:uncharacterized protein LOC112492535 [Ziziphus jujuba]